MTKRKDHSPDFRAKVALEAIREEMTMAELSKKYGVHPTQTGTWKRAAIENMASTFSKRGVDLERVDDAQIDKLHSKIGQLVVERDFLANASVQLLGTRGKNGEHGSQPECQAAMQAAVTGAVKPVLSAERRECREPSVYLVAIMDWYSRKVLSWRLSNSMEADFCVEALNEAIAKCGKPEIMNSDQGSQFTGFDWIQALKDADIKISMPLGDFTNHLPVIDGRGRWIDNRMIERLWRSLKYECIYLHAFETGSQTRTGIGKWMTYYNTERPHSTHGILTPDEAYERETEPARLAA